MATALFSKQDLKHWLTLELRPRVTDKDVLLFYTQMGILIESGTSVPLGLEALEQQAPSGRMKEIVGDLKRHVYEGQMLSQAMARYPKVFSPIYVGMIRAGESGGFLGKVFDRVVVMQEQRMELRSILRSAFAYPGALLATAVLVVIFMVTFILPRFVGIYEESGVVLPLITRVLLLVYTLLAGYWYVSVPLLAGACAAGVWYLQSPHGNAWIDHMKLDIPLIGPLFRQVYLERLLRTLGILLDSGVSIHDALQLTKTTIGNHRFEQLMTMVLDRVHQGQGLAPTLGRSDLIPPMVRQMIQTGEEAGAAGAVMSRVADFYYDRIRERVRVLTRLLEPAMTLIMGVVIGFVALGLLLPVLQLARTVRPS